MLGFRRLNRPDFGFEGAWMLFPGGAPGGSGLMLHIAGASEHQSSTLWFTLYLFLMH